MKDEDRSDGGQLPVAVVEKLVAAKNWYDQRQEIPLGTGTPLSLRWEESDQAAPGLLEEIVEAIDETIGFGRRVGD